jgi:hypothetical protein
MSQLYLGLWQYLPDDSGLGVEVSGFGYSRVPLDLEIAGSRATNRNPVTFPMVQGSWGTIRGFGVWDEYGRLLFSGPTTSQLTPQSSDVVSFLSNALAIENMVPREYWPSQPVRERKTLWERLDEEPDAD